MPERFMPKTKAPCKDCKERSVGCHGSCERYTAFRHESEEQRQQKNLETEREMRVIGVLIHGAYRQTGKKPPER